MAILILGVIVILFFLRQDTVNLSPQLSPSSTPSPVMTSPVSTMSVKVVKIIDGDTVNVEIENKTYSVRLIGIDAPEVHDPRKPVQCFAKEATTKLNEALSGKLVYLESDPTQGDKDQYNRLLRYIFLEDGTNIDKLMISGGYAHEYIYNLPYKYQEEFKQAEKEAREAERGLWADDACAAAVSPTSR